MVFENCASKLGGWGHMTTLSIYIDGILNLGTTTYYCEWPIFLDRVTFTPPPWKPLTILHPNQHKGFKNKIMHWRQLTPQNAPILGVYQLHMYSNTVEGIPKSSAPQVVCYMPHLKGVQLWAGVYFWPIHFYFIYVRERKSKKKNLNLWSRTRRRSLQVCIRYL